MLNRVSCWIKTPALFLDRDGVVIEEVNYLSRPQDVKLIPGAVEVIGECNKRQIPVIFVTNQAGIGRGFIPWDKFVAVQEKIISELDYGGVYVNAVFACPSHEDAREPYKHPNHPNRKPNPGMLIRASEIMPIDLSKLNSSQIQNNLAEN